MIQPLSGEYAVRREVLEQIAFPIGYGVETSHLIDVYHMYGLEAFAQTDLDKRVHENKPTQALGKMAFGILQTFIKRAKALGVLDKAEHKTILRQFQVSKTEYEQNLIEIIEEERPPMIEIEEYRKKFK
jgi:glucosyl-3-phosphoglycerate synthase